MTRKRGELRLFWGDPRDVWWARQESNLQPTGYEPGALPLSYGPATTAANSGIGGHYRRDLPLNIAHLLVDALNYTRAVRWPAIEGWRSREPYCRGGAAMRPGERH